MLVTYLDPRYLIVLPLKGVATAFDDLEHTLTRIISHLLKSAAGTTGEVDLGDLLCSYLDPLRE